MELKETIESLIKQKTSSSLHIYTMGHFRVFIDQEEINEKTWGREKSIQLFQYLVTSRNRRAQHKEQIIDRLWEEVDLKTGDQFFKVALHGINKALEPNRKSRTEAKYILRQGQTYLLNREAIWIDTEAMETFITVGNQSFQSDPDLAILAYNEAEKLYEGVFLPNRMYEDWSSEERERLQVLLLNALVSLCELIVEKQPKECIRLAQKALMIDHSWEDAYRLQMKAYIVNGNRPMAIKTYQKCKDILESEFGIEPLPETKKTIANILSIKP